MLSSEITLHKTIIFIEFSHHHIIFVLFQLHELQRDLDDALAKLHTAEHKLHLSDRIKQELQEKREEVMQLKNQLHDERLQRCVLS